jgi:hypothetical protein
LLFFLLKGKAAKTAMLANAVVRIKKPSIPVLGGKIGYQWSCKPYINSNIAMDKGSKNEGITSKIKGSVHPLRRVRQQPLLCRYCLKSFG